MENCFSLALTFEGQLADVCVILALRFVSLRSSVKAVLLLP